MTSGGLDPAHVANEGVLVAVIPADDAEAVVQAMRSDPAGARAAIIGEVTAAEPGRVAARTSLGVHRLVARPAGEQLPRTC